MLGATVLPVEVKKERQKNGMAEGKEPVGQTGMEAISMNPQFHVLYVFTLNMYIHLYP